MQLMKKAFASCLVASLFFSGSTLAAATNLSGKVVEFDIVTGNDKDIPDRNNAANYTYTIGFGNEVNQPRYLVDFDQTGFTLSMFGSGIADDSGITFDGFRITDINNSIPDFTGFSIQSNTAFSGLPVLSFDANHLYVNYYGLSFNPGSVRFNIETASTITAVPEPSSIALLMGGLGLILLQKRRQTK